MAWNAGKLPTKSTETTSVSDAMTRKAEFLIDPDEIDEYVDEQGNTQLFECSETKIKGIAESIMLYGQIQACIVKPKGDRWELQDGKTRWLAIKYLNERFPTKKRKLLCVVGGTSTESVMFTSNLCRRDNLKPSERVKTYIRAYDEEKMSTKVIAELEGCDTDTVGMYLRLRDLHEELFAALDANKLTLSSAIEIVKLGQSEQLLLFNFFVSHKLKLTKEDIRSVKQWCDENSSVSLDESMLEKIFEEKVKAKEGKARPVSKKTVSKVTAMLSKSLGKNVSEEDMWAALVSAFERIGDKGLKELLEGK